MYPLLATYFIGEVPINSENYKRYDKPTEIHTPAHIEELTEIVKAKIEPLQASTLQEIEPVEQVAVPEPKPAQTASTSVRQASVAGNPYAECNCTKYAKMKRPDMPNNLGNANTWYSRAAAQGYAVGYEPRAGAIGEATTGYMHVVYVESVSGDMVTVSEWNFKGPCVLTVRTVHKSNFRYIY